MTALKRRKNAEGSTLVLSLITSSLLFITSASFLLMVSHEYLMNDRSGRSTVAINLAEAGADYAIRAIQSGDINNWSGSDPKTKTLHGVDSYGGKVMGDFSMAVHDPSGSNPLVESTGYSPGIADSTHVSRTIKVKVNPGDDIPFEYMFWGKINITMTGEGETDSYDSRDGDYGGDNVGSNGDIVTNGNGKAAIKMTGNSTVNGDAATGPGGTIKTTGQAEITGEQSDDMTAQASAVEVPSDLTDLWYWDGYGMMTLSGDETYTLEAGDYKFKRIQISGNASLTIDGDTRIYITGYAGKSIQTTGNGQIVIADSADFYVDEDISISGNGLVNEQQTPPDLTMWGTDSCEDIYLAGNADFYGAVYAPNADISITGNGSGFGAFVGNEIDISGNGDLHYDEALEAVDKPGNDFTTAYWVEVE